MTVRAVLCTLQERIQENSEKEMCIHYLAECARMVTENTAKTSNGMYFTKKLNEILHPEPEDGRSGEEIVSDVLKTVGIEVI